MWFTFCFCPVCIKAKRALYRGYSQDEFILTNMDEFQIRGHLYSF